MIERPVEHALQQREEQVGVRGHGGLVEHLPYLDAARRHLAAALGDRLTQCRREVHVLLGQPQPAGGEPAHLLAQQPGTPRAFDLVTQAAQAATVDAAS